ncbi:MAG: hypothetical protein KDE59_23085 [Anaerolineales bacterium]|nr:hypothetical protein [Anaerolineales bacterium]
MSQGSLFRRVFVWTALLLGLVALLGTQPAAAKATVILVTSTGHEVAPFVNDGDCTLGEALAAAAADQRIDGCTANHFGSGGPFFIQLAPNATYTLTAIDNTLAGANGLPQITRDVTIQGYNATIERGNNAPNFRLLYVANTGKLTVDSLRLRNGTATSDGTRCQDTGWACGGAILNEGGTVVIRNSFLTNNVAEAGGALMTVDGNATIRYSTFSGNFAVGSQGQGGAIAQFGDLPILIEHSTIVNNDADKRGGGLQNEGAATINFVTFSGNGAELGGNIRNFEGTVTFSNSIIGRASEGGNCASLDGTIGSGGYNVEDANDCEFSQATDRRNTPTGLGTLDSSRFVPVMPLNSGSAAINLIPAGTNGCIAGVTGDQRYFVRANGASQGGSGCDSGAYEFDTNSLITAIKLDNFKQLPPEQPNVALWYGAALLLLFSAWAFRRTIRRYADHLYSSKP